MDSPIRASLQGVCRNPVWLPVPGGLFCHVCPAANRRGNLPVSGTNQRLIVAPAPLSAFGRMGKTVMPPPTATCGLATQPAHEFLRCPVADVLAESPLKSFSTPFPGDDGISHGYHQVGQCAVFREAAGHRRRYPPGEAPMEAVACSSGTLAKILDLSLGQEAGMFRPVYGASSPSSSGCIVGIPYGPAALSGLYKFSRIWMDALFMRRDFKGIKGFFCLWCMQYFQRVIHDNNRLLLLNFWHRCGAWNIRNSSFFMGLEIKVAESLCRKYCVRKFRVNFLKTYIHPRIFGKISAGPVMDLPHLFGKRKLAAGKMGGVSPLGLPKAFPAGSGKAGCFGRGSSRARVSDPGPRVSLGQCCPGSPAYRRRNG